MHDMIQQGMEALAAHNAVTRAVAVLCATVVIVLLAVAWLIVAVRHRRTLMVAEGARIAALAALALLLAKVLTHVVSDPRPYLVDHVAALTPLSHDNGFPSDHTLLAAVLAASLWWIERRLIPPFVVGVALVMLGRLGVGAHHTIDVLGSVAITLVAALVARAAPVPVRWDRPLLPALRRASAAVVRPIVQRDPSA
jgi:membrane-associated phospholipid phosphatase